PITEDAEAGARFMARYVTAFGAAALSGLKLGVYTHSAVGRDLLMEVLSALGAEVTEFGRSDTFIPVDTEAVEPEARARFTGWAAGLDALVSTDGDSDRPMVTDATGRVIPGDILGQITARYLGAETIVTPISSNSSVTERGFEAVHLTRIGSPFVIAGMEAATGRVAGYEANGGFLLGFEAAAPGPLPALMTRDSFLPIIAPLAMARAAGQPLAALAAQETLRHTAADRLTEMPMAASQALLGQLRDESDARVRLLSAAGLGTEASCDETDGLRMTDAAGAVLHLRPSGNAPELRLYVEARSPAQAEEVLTAAKRAVAERL
ncbi:MAG: phosphomannomutase, partial [Pseudomonadota bacterium]